MGPERALELNRPRGPRVGWRLPAVALVGVLVGLIALGTLDSGAPPPTPGPSHTAVPVAVATPIVTSTSSPAPSRLIAPPTPAATPGAAGEVTGELPSKTTSHGTRYVDGIPTSIKGRRVERVGAVRSLAVGTSLLVAGWYQPAHCGPVLASTWCAPGVLADLPAGSSRTDELILDRGLGKLPGARVVRATVALDVNCMLDARPVCAPMLTIKRVVWSGDNATHTRPIDPVTLLSQLDVRFPFTDFMPYPKEDGCRASLPLQSYSAHILAGLQARSQLALPVSVVLLFPSARARRRAQQSVMTGQACPAFAATLAEVPQAGWISQRNVMVLSTDPGTLPEVQAAIEAAIQEGD